ncbi:MAG: hypothetical protein Q9162_006642 [Coniocarpon cinnabarinum]
MATRSYSLPRIPLFEQIKVHDQSSPAVVHSESGQTFSYGQLLGDVAKATQRLEGEAKGKSLRGERIAFLVENGYDYVVTFLAALGAQAIALPLAPSFPSSELRYIINQSQAALLLSTTKQQSKATEVLQDEIEHQCQSSHVPNIPPATTSTSLETISLEPLPSDDQSGLMLYTSGTTSRPKGVLLPNTPTLTAQYTSLIEAWHYRPSDRLLHCLPLHHIHGTMNALLAPLAAGCCIEFLQMTPDNIWSRFAVPFNSQLQKHEQHRVPITFFTVVPTIYSNLLNTFPKLPPDVQKAAQQAIAPNHLRLNISGSAALPTPIKESWTKLSSGNVLLERYGMTEVGMALSCGLNFADRVDGSVGFPLPSVEARLVDTETNTIIRPGEELDAKGADRQGEIQLRGPTIFREYFRNPSATASEFVEPEPGDANTQRWFKTGDVAIRKNVEGAGKSDQAWAKGGLYFIQGRKSADIIKSGGEKVSALEVEREMLSLKEVSEVAVVGVPSAKWGQKVGAVVVLSEEGKVAGKDGGSISPLQLRNKLKERLVAYKCPLEYKMVDSIPRNAMGKVNKKSLVGQVFADRVSPPPE